MNQIILGLILLFVATLGSIELLLNNKKTLPPIQSNLTHKDKKTIYINKVWKSDIQRLQSSGELPQEFNMINQIIFIPTDPLTKELTAFLKAPVKINKKGKFRIEITIITHQSEKNKTQILLQHNLIDLENENTIWELNRTYNLTSN